ncbi:MAG TPA: hypothetical protein DHW15_02840 [Bacteroidetes bacterium]|nr:MAG: hypothetical protein ABR94_00315 [Sphingobacteriales bacterium BACL12 MAG-120802-bin5]KRP11772.1 MAG: hypothetical protein ABR95_05890 [Sphingobacteriales bacterium BACL12 MAG-120813-bin55]HCK21118.1 hypothetical protein [Bacteroidota bacterium]
MRILSASIWLILSLGWNTLSAQNDSIALSDAAVPEEHSPRKAALYSGILPGLGQAYNEKYWKIPIVYTGLGITTYSIVFNARYFNELKDAYAIRTDGDPETIDAYANILPLESQLIQYAQFYKKNLDISVLILAGVWLLNVVDAVVDAHLYNFDISDDLSLQILPTANPWGGLQAVSMHQSATFGLTIKLNLP